MPKKKVEKKVDKLTVQQALFVSEYMKDYNANRAAVAAGIVANDVIDIQDTKDTKDASINGIKDIKDIKDKKNKKKNNVGELILKKAVVKKEVDKCINAKIDVIAITPDVVLSGIFKIAKDEYTKNGDRLRAYELLGKHLKLFTDKMDIKSDLESGTDIKVIIDEKLKKWAK